MDIVIYLALKRVKEKMQVAIYTSSTKKKMTIGILSVYWFIFIFYVTYRLGFEGFMGAIILGTEIFWITHQRNIRYKMTYN